MENNFKKVIKKLGNDLSEKILAEFKYNEIREIRLSAGKKAKIVTNKGCFELGKNLQIKDIKEIFAALCDYSVHTYKEDICRGFITVCGGFRIGICGTAVYENEKIINIKDISAINIRVPHEIKNAAEKILNFSDSNILVIGPPCSGKTTVLRDFARRTSGNHFVTIVDERMEIAGICKGEASFDIGEATVLNGFLKADGMEIAARTLAPDYIICDEFGTENDVQSSLYVMKSGVKIVASMHAEDPEDFLKKTITETIINNRIFDYFVFLNRNFEITTALKADDLLL